MKNIWQETQHSEDPLVVRCGIALMLALRPYATDQDCFGSEFQDLLLGLLSEFTNLEDRPHYKNLRLNTQIVEGMAGYYLRYLDMNAQNVFPESERRVAVAWWLGWHFRNLIAQISEESTEEHRADYLQRWLNNVNLYLQQEEIAHRFSLQPTGIARSHTIYPSQPLAAATLSMLAPSEKAHLSNYTGLINPTTLLTPQLHQQIIDLTLFGAIQCIQEFSPCPEEILP